MILKYKTNYTQYAAETIDIKKLTALSEVQEVNESTKEVITDRWNYISDIDDCGVYYDVSMKCVIVEYYRYGSVIHQAIHDEAYLIDETGRTIEVLHR